MSVTWWLSSSASWHTNTHTITRVCILVSIFRQRFCCRQQTQLSTRPSHTYNSIIHILH
jgi:hypothetical protein